MSSKNLCKMTYIFVFIWLILSNVMCVACYESGLGDSSIVNEIITLFDQYGDGQYMFDEDVTQKSHALQIAYLLLSAGAPDEIVIGGFLHDIGQIARQDAVNIEDLHAYHDEFGYAWLKSRGFPEVVAECALYHVYAKIVLCEKDMYYFDRLSEASKASCVIQSKKYENSPMRSIFEHHPRKDDFLTVRLCDDMAKESNFSAITVQDMIPYLSRVLHGENTAVHDLKWRNVIASKAITMQHMQVSKEVLQ